MHKKGFTLVEIIVSLGLFSIVAVVSLGALIRIMDANRKAQTMQSAMTNLNYALDSISREMRVGSKYVCKSGTSFNSNSIGAPEACGPSGLTENGTTQVGAVIAFNSKDKKANGAAKCNLIYVYRFRPDNGAYKFEKGEQSNCPTPVNENDYSSLIDDNVIITGYHVRVYDSLYPLAVIRISGYTGVREKDKTYFDVQTAISSRNQ